MARRSAAAILVPNAAGAGGQGIVPRLLRKPEGEERGFVRFHPGAERRMAQARTMLEAARRLRARGGRP